MSYEPEFEQAYKEVEDSLVQSTLFKHHPQYANVLKVLRVPQRIVQFRVTWENDKGEQEVATGYRVQLSNNLGPFKGGLRFHESVNLSVLKFLAFEQVFKNALTGTSIGGAKGGLNVNPQGRSDKELRRICQAFMAELHRHIGQDVDIPAGDINVGGKVIGLLFGAWRQYSNTFEGVLTGKGTNWGASPFRPEATGYGVVYITNDMIEYATKGKESIKGKRVAISGSGNVAQYAALKVLELGGTVVSLSDSKGAIVSESGISKADIEAVAAGKSDYKPLSAIFAESKSDIKFIPGARPWTNVTKVDVALPCATQNEVSGQEAEYLVKAGVKYVAEGSNMGSTPEAIEIFEKQRLAASSSSTDSGVWFCPPKLANMAGVMVSQFEMAQNSQRVTWEPEYVDSLIKKHMKEGLMLSIETASKYSNENTSDALPSLLKGANLAGFIKVADAMIDHGDVF
ncbi:glutamate dehydrogenase (NADP(+)) gdh1 [Hanseniaspora osmophila]|uniref:Glutamate dehydrogenase n=1 Tax=Hanseniaspora osmophila TaxID=56408 RepID=A0A1E5S099_9ASCO|nr:NADP-specific glutamate dehydrogenase 1 [Hanseniaspora osmophila]